MALKNSCAIAEFSVGNANSIFTKRRNYLNTCTWIYLEVPKEFVKLPTEFFSNADQIKKIKNRTAFYLNGEIHDGELPQSRKFAVRKEVEGARNLRWR